MVKNLPVNTGDVGSVPELEDPLEKEMATHSNILCLGNPMDRGSWRATYSPWGWVRVEHNLATKQQKQLDQNLKTVTPDLSLRRFGRDVGAEGRLKLGESG